MQLIPNPLAAEQPHAQKQTMRLEGNEIVVVGPSGSASVTRPEITNSTTLLCAMSNMKIMFMHAHPALFAHNAFSDTERLVTAALQRNDDQSLVESGLILAQLFLWFGTNVERHVRLTKAIDGFDAQESSL